MSDDFLFPVKGKKHQVIHKDILRTSETLCPRSTGVHRAQREALHLQPFEEVSMVSFFSPLGTVQLTSGQTATVLFCHFFNKRMNFSQPLS